MALLTEIASGGYFLYIGSVIVSLSFYRFESTAQSPPGPSFTKLLKHKTPLSTKILPRIKQDASKGDLAPFAEHQIFRNVQPWIEIRSASLFVFREGSP